MVGVFGQCIDPYADSHQRIVGESHIERVGECVAHRLIRQDTAIVDLGHGIGTGAIVHHHRVDSVGTIVTQGYGDNLITQAAGRCRKHRSFHFNLYSRRSYDGHQHTGFVTGAPLVDVAHPCRVIASEEQGIFGRRELPVAHIAIERGAVDTRGVGRKTQGRAVPYIGGHSQRGPLHCLGRVLCNHIIERDGIFHHAIMLVDKGHIGVVAEAGRETVANGQATVGNTITHILHHQRLAGLYLHIAEGVDLVVERRGGRDGHQGVAFQICRSITDVGELDRTLAVVDHPVGHGRRETGSRSGLVELHLRDAYYRHGTALRDIVGAVGLQHICHQGVARVEGLGVGRVVVPIYLRAAARCTTIVVHLPRVDAGRGHYGGRSGIGHRVDYRGRSGRVIATDDGEDVGIVGMVGVVGEGEPHTQRVGGIQIARRRHIEHCARVIHQRVFGRNRTVHIEVVHRAVVLAVGQMQHSGAGGIVGQRAAIANQQHELGRSRQRAVIIQRVDEGFHLEVIGERTELERTGAGDAVATHGVEHIHGHTRNGDTNTLDIAVVGTQVNQTAVQEVGVDRDRSGIFSHHGSPCLDGTIGRGAPTVHHKTGRIVNVVRQMIVDTRHRLVAEGIVGIVERNHNIVNEAAVVQRAAAECGRGHIGARRGSHLHRVVDHIDVVGLDDVERRALQVGRTVVGADNHVVGHYRGVVAGANHIAHTHATGAMRGIYLVAFHQHGVAGVELQHIAGIAVHVVHLVVGNHHRVLVLHLDGVLVLVVEGVVAHHVAVRTDIGGLAFDVDTHTATVEGAAFHGHMAGIAGVEHRGDTQRRRRVGKTVDELAALEAHTAAAHTQRDHIGQRTIAAHELHIAEAHIGRCRQVDDGGGRKRAVGIYHCRGRPQRLKDQVVLLGQPVDGGHDERRVRTGGQPHDEAVVHAAAAQREEELVDGGEIGVGTANGAHATHRAGADDEVGAERIVQRLMVAVLACRGRQGVLHPHTQVVETGSQRHIGRHLHGGLLAGGQIAAPVEVAIHIVVYPVGDAHRREGLGAIVLQLHRQAVVILRHGVVVVGTHQFADAGIVEQRQQVRLVENEGRAVGRRVGRKDADESIRREGVVAVGGAGVVGEERAAGAGRGQHLHVQVLREIGVAVVGNLHAHIVAGVEEGVLEVDCVVQTRGQRRDGQRPVVDRLHHVGGEVVVGSVGGVAVARRHIAHLDLDAGMGAGRIEVGTQREAHGRDGAGAVAALRHQRRIVDYLAPMVGIVGQGEELGSRVDHRAGERGRLLSGLLRIAADAAVVHPRIHRRREGGHVGVARGVAHYAVEAHQRVVADEGDARRIDIGGARFQRHHQLMLRRVAARRVVQIDRIGVYAALHRRGGLQAHTHAARMRILQRVGIVQHRDTRCHHTLRAGIDADIVQPPAHIGRVQGRRQRAPAQHKLDQQFALVGRHRCRYSIVQVEALAAPLLVVHRRIHGRIPRAVGIRLLVESALLVETRRVGAGDVVLLRAAGRPVRLVRAAIVDEAHQVVGRGVLRHTADVVEIQRDVAQRGVLGEIQRVQHQLHFAGRGLHQLH